MEKLITKECLWFHRWLSLGIVKIILPVLGPFDPRADEERTEERYKSICVKCGKEKVREIPMWI